MPINAWSGGAGYPTWYASTSGITIYPTATYGYPQQSQYLTEIKPPSDRDWLDSQIEEICALA